MTIQSTIAVVVVVCLLAAHVWVSAGQRRDTRALTAALLRVAARAAAGGPRGARPSSTSTTPDPRLMCAQHWARGALSYPLGDPSRHLVMGLAIVALLRRTDADLVQTLEALGNTHEAFVKDELGHYRVCTPIASTVRAALGELTQARAGEGYAIEEPDAWNWALLDEKAADVLMTGLRDTERQSRMSGESTARAC